MRVFSLHSQLDQAGSSCTWGQTLFRMSRSCSNHPFSRWQLWFGSLSRTILESHILQVQDSVCAYYPGSVLNSLCWLQDSSLVWEQPRNSQVPEPDQQIVHQPDYTALPENQALPDAVDGTSSPVVYLQSWDCNWLDLSLLLLHPLDSCPSSHFQTSPSCCEMICQMLEGLCGCSVPDPVRYSALFLTPFVPVLI